MAMIAAARLRRAVARIEVLRPYANAIRRMTREAAQDSGSLKRVPILQEHAEERTVGLLLVSRRSWLAGAFNSNVVRAGIAAGVNKKPQGRPRHLLRVRPESRLVVGVFVPWRSPKASPATATVLFRRCPPNSRTPWYRHS